MTTETVSITNIFAVILSALFAMESAKIISVITSVANKVFKTKEDPRVSQLKKEINERREELNKISPTSQFAEYFKKERQINKMMEELSDLELKTASGTSNVKIGVAVRVTCQLLALVLLRYVSGITAFCIPENIFWPFNVLLRFPAILGNDSCPREFAEVSGFSISFLMLHLLKFMFNRLFKSNIKL